MNTHSVRARAALILTALVAALLMPLGMAASAGADVVVTPSSNDLTLGPGDVFGPENVNVQIPAGEGPTAADVYFLSDTTGSMGGPIAAVKSAATTSLTGIQAGLPGVDVAFGVSDYKDGASGDPYNFRVDQVPTTVIADVQAGINTWSASGGGDAAEGQIQALDQLAINPAVGWRPGAERIVVWFGDCPGHSPQLGVTEAQATADLQAAHITVMALSTNTGCTNGLNGTDGGAVAGQANRITAATGGTHTAGVSSATIVDNITDAINSAVTNINSVSLVPSSEVASYVTNIDPTAYGPLDGHVSHSLDFAVTFQGTHCGPSGPETVNGSLDVIADGNKVGEKTVTIHVPGCNVPPTNLALNCQLAPVAVGQPATLSYSFTDPDAGDPHVVGVVWDDGSSSSANLAAGVTSGSAQHIYTVTGTYNPTVTVTDSFGASVTATCANFTVVYDPSAGFVTGGGTIQAVAGSYPANPALAGRANFGFVSKYQKGKVVPNGNTEFQFQDGDLNFHSEDYQWLIVNGTTRAQFKGTGTINGAGSYQFIVTVTDGSKTGVDTFRIKITDGSTVIFDNKLGGTDDFAVAPTQNISTGSIVIHA